MARELANWTKAFPKQHRTLVGNRKKNSKPLRRSPVNRISDNRRRDHRIYNQKRIWFLVKHPWCAWALKQTPPKKIRSTQIHHMRGRSGSLYLNEKFWRAVSQTGHNEINLHPETARQLGLLCQVGEWGVNE